MPFIATLRTITFSHVLVKAICSYYFSSFFLENYSNHVVAFLLLRWQTRQANRHS